MMRKPNQQRVRVRRAQSIPLPLSADAGLGDTIDEYTRRVKTLHDFDHFFGLFFAASGLRGDLARGRAQISLIVDVANHDKGDAAILSARLRAGSTPRATS